MNKEKQKKISKKLSYHLRHAPEEIGLTLEKGGWVNVEDLLHALDVKKHFYISTDDLLYVVENCEKQRFSLSDDGRKIRANQGHSTEVDLQLEERVPPETLFHGTADRFLQSIFEHGLKKMNRHHVHLSSDKETATKVGQRHGRVVILTVESGKMHQDGHKFYCSENGVWLTDEVPPEYLDIEK